MKGPSKSYDAISIQRFAERLVRESLVEELRRDMEADQELFEYLKQPEAESIEISQNIQREVMS